MQYLVDRSRLAVIATLLSLMMMPFVGCSKAEVREAVLSPGQKISANNRFGEVEISYVSPTERRYHWDGFQRVVKMIPRKEPFRGILGLYEPAAGGARDGVRLVVQESNIYFSTYDEVYVFLRQSRDVMDWSYTKDGLVVGFGRSPSRDQVNVDLWQVFVDGKKPSDLRGSSDGRIHITNSR